MKILYVGNHGQLNNDDEGAIELGLKRLGCDVVARRTSFKSNLEEYDFVLFHKLPLDEVDNICSNSIGVSWYFDGIGKGFKDNDLYADSIIDKVHRGFFTDGDYVDKVNRKNIHLLRQGFDAKHDTLPLEAPPETKRDLLFIGTVDRSGYNDRFDYLEKLTKRFGPMAHTQYSLFKENLTKAVRETMIMLAMPPVTDRYWSNRVYLLGGRGAFLIHPWSQGLYEEFGENLVFYKNYDELEAKITYFLDSPDERFKKQQSLQRIILEGHCYEHRCKKLLEIINAGKI